MRGSKRRTMSDYLDVLRAVDHEGHESRTAGCWTLTTTGEIAARVKMSTQQVTPLLHDLVADRLLMRCEQGDGSVTWHLLEPACKLLRAESEVAMPQVSGPLRRF